MQASPFSYHDLHTNYTKIIQKPFQNQNFNSHKLCIHTITLYKWRCFSRSQTLPYILTKRKLIKKLPKTYPSHGSPNNQKETKSHGSLSDSTINHKKTTSHGSPCESTINHKETTSDGSPSDSTINHKETTSDGSPSDFTINHKETTSDGSPSDSTINHKETTSEGSPSDSTINHKETTSDGSPSDSTINHKKISHGAHDISQCIMPNYGILHPTYSIKQLHK